MANNLVIAGLLLGVLGVFCLSGGVEASDGIEDSLSVIKEFAWKDTASRSLTRELENLNPDKMCTAIGLASLRNAVEIIQGMIWGKSKRLKKAIDVYTKRAMELCFETANNKWMDKIDACFSREFPSFKSLDSHVLQKPSSGPASVSIVGDMSNHNTLATGLILLKGKVSFDLVDIFTAQMLNSFSKHVDKRDSNDYRPRSLSEDIKRLIIRPCKRFHEQPETTDILEPLRDLTMASDSACDRKGLEVVLWTGRLMICEWFLSTNVKMLVWKVYLGSLYHG